MGLNIAISQSPHRVRIGKYDHRYRISYSVRSAVDICIQHSEERAKGGYMLLP